MEGIVTKPYVRYQVFSTTLEPEDDLLLTFELMASVVRPENDCSNAILVNCTEQGVTGEVQAATLIWKLCSSTQYIEVAPEDIITENGKTISITVEVEDVYLSDSNDFELQVDTDSGTFIIARGRIFL
jgi:hypothetical protein